MIVKLVNKSKHDLPNYSTIASAVMDLIANIDDPMSNVFKKTMQVVLKSRSRSNLNEKLSGLLESNIENEVNLQHYYFLVVLHKQ